MVRGLLFTLDMLCIFRVTSLIYKGQMNQQPSTLIANTVVSRNASFVVL